MNHLLRFCRAGLAGLLLCAWSSDGTADPVSEGTTPPVSADAILADRQTVIGELLTAAANRNDLLRAEALLAAGADVNYADSVGKTALFYCTKADMARLLLSHGANIAHRADFHEPVIAAAAAAADVETIKVLVGNGADVNDSGDRAFNLTPLHMALGHRNLPVARYLLEGGADFGAYPNSRDCHGDAPLHYCVYSQHGAETAELLLKHGADVNLKNAEGLTPLELARKHGLSEDSPLVRLLAGHQ